MARRRAVHGKQAGSRTGYVWENTASDEVRPVPPGSAAPVERREDGTVTPAGAAELARKRWALAGQPNFGDGAAPWMPPAPELLPFDDARQDLLHTRWDELSAASGGVSSGVGAKLRGWAAMHAGAEYWAAKFYATGDPDAYDRMVRGFKAASTAEDQARDAAAWEAQARRDASPSGTIPWLASPRGSQ